MTTGAELIKASRNKPAAFNRHILGRVHRSIPDGYTPQQVDICRSVAAHRKTVVQSCHGSGKTYLAGPGIGLHYLYTHPDSTVLLISPSYQHLNNVGWAETTKAWRGARIRLPGRLLKSPTMKIEVAEKWFLLGLTADTSPEKISGFHGGDILVIADECSDAAYTETVMTSLDGLNATRYLYLGNPIRHGAFKALCDSADGTIVNRIVLSALDSPHAALDHSPVGMADKGWIGYMRLRYGEDSPEWRTRVLGLFADEDTHVLIPGAWLDHCTTPPDPTDPHGSRRVAVDLAGGNGGDSSVILVRDDDQVLFLDSSNSWTYPEGVAERCRDVALQWHVRGEDVVYDAAGLGAGFGYALAQHGLPSAYGYVGAEGGGRWATNFRGASALALKDRLDPSRNARPFFVPPEYRAALRPQVAELRYELAGKEQIRLEAKDQLKARLGRSPDELDALIMSFCR